MRLEQHLQHPTLHSALTNVLDGDHHRRPGEMTISNTSLLVPPLPGDPGTWDIPVDDSVVGAVVSLRSVHMTGLGGGRAGCIVVVTRSPIEAASFSIGGSGTLSTTAYNAIYTKASAALNLSHKIFDSSGVSISLTHAELILIVASRFLRLMFTNYSAGMKTLDARGEVTLFS